MVFWKRLFGIGKSWNNEFEERSLNDNATFEARKWYDSVKEESNYDFWRECFECYKAGYRQRQKEERNRKFFSK